MFFLHAPFTLFDASSTLLLKLPRLPLGLCLTTFKGHILMAGAGRADHGDAEGAKFGAAGSSAAVRFAVPA
ncbi:hypothetical protein RRF57_008970 [Xylaria bambusicola]|uniref:Uncharacterized protein n=1 Tax=Xylaria bambusicola TaxID=326684 RepID=A0AAN7Z7H1_9PEZI